MGTSQPSAMSLKSHFTVNISFPTKKRPNIATFCTSFFMLLLGKKNEFRTEKRLFLVFLYGIRVFRLQNYTLDVQPFCAVVFLSFFSVFYSLYSGFIKLPTSLSKTDAKIRNNSLLAQKHFIKLPYFTHFYPIKLPYFPNFTPLNFLIFPYQQRAYLLSIVIVPRQRIRQM